jgi:23S rRNA (uracil1939-C5)-methyltransferase
LPDPVIEELEIAGLGRQGDGLVAVDGGQLAVPGALPGERVQVERAGKTARLLKVLEPSADRVVARCPHFGPCGGCRLQHLSPVRVAEFKRTLVIEALERVGIKTPVAPVLAAFGRGRRRITLHAGRGGAGFNRRRSHDIHPIDHCPILVPELDRATEIVRAIFATVGPCDVGLTVADNGLDVGVRTVRGAKCQGKGGGKGQGKQGARSGLRSNSPGDRLAMAGRTFALARLTLNGELMWQETAPEIVIGRAVVPLPIGGFLQASARADEVLADLVCQGVGRAKQVADLFCGVGPFALRLAENARVFACESSLRSIEALEAGWRAASGLRGIKTEVRDLYNDPLEARELQHFDAVVLDPPRAGARAQAVGLAVSEVPTIVFVSCDPTSFARDAAILCGGGYGLEWVRPVDQFEHSEHVEIVGLFKRQWNSD